MFGRSKGTQEYAESLDTCAKACEPYEEKLTATQWERRADSNSAEAKRLATLELLLEALDDSLDSEPYRIAAIAEAYKAVRGY